MSVGKYSPWEPTATKVFTVGTYCYVAVCRRGGRLGGARRFGVHKGRRGAGHIVAAARLQLVFNRVAYTTTSLRSVTLKCRLTVTNSSR